MFYNDVLLKCEICIT